MIRKRIRSYPKQYGGSVKSWRNALSGTPAFLIGNAPSLSDIDLSLIKNQFSIGINRVFPPYVDYEPTILMWQDPELWYGEKHRVTKIKSIKYCRTKADVSGQCFHFKLTIGSFKLPECASVLHGQGSTGPLAFQLAYLLGCDPIVLLGMDCCYKDGKTDYYGVNYHHRPHTLKNCKKGLHWISTCKSKRTIINCSNNDVFPEKEDLGETVKRVDLKKAQTQDSLIKRIISKS